VQDAFPQFKGRMLSATLLDAHRQMGGAMPMRAVAEQLHREMEVAGRNQLATAAVARQNSTARPNTSGGAAPSPAQQPDFARMDSDDVSKFVASQMRAWDASQQ
jgi:hypothetical protein